MNYYQIYGLYSDRNYFDIRYVGVTKQRLCKRLLGHRSIAGKEKSYVHNWVQKEIKDGFKIYIKLLEKGVPENKVISKEVLYIMRYKKITKKLVNISNGGNGCVGYNFKPHTKEHKLKLSHASLGRKKSPEHCINTSKGLIKCEYAISKRKPVLCYTKDGEFVAEYFCQREAGRQMRPNLKPGNSSRGIRKAIKKGDSYSAYGFRWRLKKVS